MAESPTVHFDHSLYNQASVETAAAAYASLLTIQLDAADARTTVTFSDLDPEHGPMLVDAFCNHVLFETIHRHRADEPST